MISLSEMMATETAPEFVTTTKTETERIENSSEVDEEEEEKIRRQKKSEEEVLEAKCLPGIISAYLNYPKAAEENLKKCERSYQKLSPAHKALVTHFPTKLQRLRRCISMKSHFIYNMLQVFEPPIDLSKHMREPITGALSIEGFQRDETHHHDHSLTNTEIRINNKTCEFVGGQINHDHGSVPFSSQDWLDSSLQTHVPQVDVNKVRWVIRNIVRDWGAEGQRERDECYKPILEEIDSLFPDRHKESTQSPDEWTIYPWIHTNCNSLSNDDQLRPISIPDIHPASAGVTEGFSMCGGDFVEVFNESSQAYEHGLENEMSIELSLEDVKRVASHYGFEMENRYYPVFWTMRKKCVTTT
ncbi:hypothetical protein ARALYDRAFT_902263 [Arabidopsis lyrata subsp. lyrata]|uniref:Uncharacterized protein n=1 Tax=Arabidopsis lyrata subsp. lyrata TaxID=81972 RepID=D7LED9_ARALL|nr:hypothetical protein ARALYDRAFT_902263 [Arabidopsis lyrata subsp. lyrata]